jgi:transcriptional regulator NrdR family protein
VICPKCNSSHIAIDGRSSTRGNGYRDLFFCNSCTHVFDAREALAAENGRENIKKKTIRVEPLPPLFQF